MKKSKWDEDLPEDPADDVQVSWGEWLAVGLLVAAVFSIGFILGRVYA